MRLRAALEDPRLLAGFADARCEGGQLTITEIGEPPRDFMSRILDWMMGPENYHPIEYQLFYLDIRTNAYERVKAFVASRAGARASPAPRDAATGGDIHRESP